MQNKISLLIEQNSFISFWLYKNTTGKMDFKLATCENKQVFWFKFTIQNISEDFWNKCTGLNISQLNLPLLLGLKTVGNWLYANSKYQLGVPKGLPLKSKNTIT